uniref:Endoplasmic reticulum metallopeptidase 1 n=1 Tax=Esox lucius TaxID=8010 RepID=A0A3P8XQI1_ESOLU
MLANCHFDTVANSPGASDNAVGCAVMLEVLHSLANLSTPLKHGVVFVFNGAEENMLQGSHGFITQHPWANQIRAFINLDSAGVGGKEMMFQAGPNSPWLVQAYVHAAKHPFASVVAQEIFQSGMIPSDTDFRIYSHFGKIPGIDLAFIENGFIYHTKYDTPDRILTDSIQRAGDNILAILKHLMMSKELGNFSEAHPGQMVFFDLLGMVMVAYPARIGTIINYVTAVATFLYLFIKCCYTGNIETHLDSAETTLANAETIHASAEPSQTSCVDQGDCVDGETTLTGAETLDDAEIIQASPDPPPTLWNGLVNCSRRACCYLVKLVLATLLLIISWIITGLTVYIIALVVSLMGRSMFWYSNLYAGIFLYGSAATGMMVLIHTVAKNLYYRIHFIYLVRSTKGLLASLGTVFTVFLLLVFCGLFFPYTADPSAPRPKRVFIQHITSTIHDLDGQVESKDSGLLINSEDFTDMQHITPLIPEINNTVRRESCHVRPFCFWPWFVSVRNNWYIPAAEVFPKSPVEFQLLSKENTKWGTVKMTFEVKGPSHMSFYFETHRGAFLASWSFANEMHPFYENRHLSISYSHGIDAPVWNFSIEIQPPRKDDPSGPEEMVSVAFNSYYYFGEDQRTVQLDNMLERFPKWAFVSSWASIYQMYRY